MARLDPGRNLYLANMPGSAEHRTNLMLKPDQIEQSARLLAIRIHERFGGRSLDLHASAFAALTGRVLLDGPSIARPPKWLRAIGLIGGFGAILLIALPFWMARRLEQPSSLVESLQSLDSAITIFAGAVAGYFTMRSLESANSRRRALHGLHELRHAAHVIDMLQASKSPAKLLFRSTPTSSSPLLEEDPVLLARYLVYCSELYALISKVAVLYGSWVPDPTVLSAVDDIEDLCSDLEQRVSMKISQLNLVNLAR